MTDIRSLSINELTEALISLGEPKYRAAQLFSWLHEKRVSSFEKMTNLPKSLRAKLSDSFGFYVPKQVRKQVSKDGTVKYLWAMEDGAFVETVRMRYNYGDTACISSQVGCKMGCAFCASGMNGFERNLTVNELLEEVYSMERGGQSSDPSCLHNIETLSHIVVMGMGEPLENYENLVKFIRILGDAKGRDFSLRNITVSTCGLVPEIYKLSEEGLPITLALSLHAPNDEKRRELMPVARRYTLQETLKAVEAYYLKTGRRCTLEYALIKGVNDSAEDAKELSGLVKSIEGSPHVNLIPVNPVTESGFLSGDARGFQLKLEKNGINVTIRKELGRDIDSACGQLRRRMISE